MEEGKKKTVMIVIIIACLVVAGVITFSRRSGGGGDLSSISEEEMTWVKCNNPVCKAEYQTGLKAYYQYVQENVNPLAQSTAALVCEKCGEHSVYRAEKCPNCGIVFLRNSVPGDHPDRCPKCKYSETEESRKRRIAERGQ